MSNLPPDLRLLRDLAKSPERDGSEAPPLLICADLHPATVTALREAGYEVLRQIGSGGGGHSWLALRTSVGDQRVVLKILPQDLEGPEEAVPLLEALLEREAVLSAALPRNCRPHIIERIRVPTASSTTLCLVREFIDGPTLEDFALDEKTNLVSLLVQFVKMCTAVHTLHTHCLVHCDIKPANVILHQPPDEDEPRPVLIDFAMAHSLRARLQNGAHFSSLGGTEGFMAPEAKDPKNLPTSHWDIYSLGATLHAIVGPRIPRRLERIITKARALQPSARYASAAHMASAITTFLQIYRNHLPGAGGPRIGTSQSSATTGPGFKIHSPVVGWMRAKRSHITAAVALVLGAMGLNKYIVVATKEINEKKWFATAKQCQAINAAAWSAEPLELPDYEGRPTADRPTVLQEVFLYYDTPGYGLFGLRKNLYIRVTPLADGVTWRARWILSERVTTEGDDRSVWNRREIQGPWTEFTFHRRAGVATLVEKISSLVRRPEAITQRLWDLGVEHADASQRLLVATLRNRWTFEATDGSTLMHMDVGQVWCYVLVEVGTLPHSFNDLFSGTGRHTWHEVELEEHGKLRGGADSWSQKTRPVARQLKLSEQRDESEFPFMAKYHNGLFRLGLVGANR